MATLEAAAVSVPAVRMWTLHEGDKVQVTTFAFLNFSCFSARNKNWYNCCYDFVPAINEERYQVELE